MVDSDLYPGTKRKAWKVRYNQDGQEQEFEEEELRPLLMVADAPERKAIISGIAPAFDYLESRITGTCDVANYSCEHMYKVSAIPPFPPPTYPSPEH